MSLSLSCSLLKSLFSHVAFSIVILKHLVDLAGTCKDNPEHMQKVLTNRKDEVPPGAMKAYDEQDVLENLNRTAVPKEKTELKE